MKTIQEFFKKEEIRIKVKNEIPCFKHSHVRFYIKEMNNGSLEFWAYGTVYQFGDMEMGHCGEQYLGKYEDGEVTRCDNFYSLDMNMQRGLLRLLKDYKIYA